MIVPYVLNLGGCQPSRAVATAGGGLCLQIFQRRFLPQNCQKPDGENAARNSSHQNENSLPSGAKLGLLHVFYFQITQGQRRGTNISKSNIQSYNQQTELIQLANIAEQGLLGQHGPAFRIARPEARTWQNMHITHADVSTWRSGCLTLRGPLTSQKRGKQSFKESARLMSLIEITCDSLLYENSLQQSIVSHTFTHSYVIPVSVSLYMYCLHVYHILEYIMIYTYIV